MAKGSKYNLYRTTLMNMNYAMQGDSLHLKMQLKQTDEERDLLKSSQGTLQVSLSKVSVYS